MALLFGDRENKTDRPLKMNMARPHEPSVDYDVIIIGAGISGISFAYNLQKRNPSLTYCILEGRHEIGGTWSLFQYPGEKLSTS